MRFIILVSELSGALCGDSVNTPFVVESMLRHGMAALSQWMSMSAPWTSMPRELIKSRPKIISSQLILRSTTCSDWLINLLACSSGKLELVAVLVLVVRTSAAVDQCHSCLVFFTGSLSAFDLVRMDSLAPGSTRSLTSRFLDCLSFLPTVMTSLTKMIGLKWACFSFLEDLVCLSFLLVGFCRVFNR